MKRSTPVSGTARARAKPSRRRCIVLAPGGGRAYPMGRLRSIFKADGKETAGTYSVSEWWLDPNTAGPGAHSHDEDHVYYVLEGTMSVRLGKRWVEAGKGAFILIPGGVVHDFENRSAGPAGILSFNNRGGFEDRMAGISEWFAEHPAGDAI